MEDNIKMDRKNMIRDSGLDAPDTEYISVTDRRTLSNKVVDLWVPQKVGNFLTS
jgi:hypothetical protein